MKCDRCWKQMDEEEAVAVEHPVSRQMTLRFCRECAELTGNLPRGD